MKLCTMCRHSLWHDTQLLTLVWNCFCFTVMFSASTHILSRHSQTSERPFKLSFRSKPIFDVTAHLYFEPKMISIENISCPSRTDQAFQMGLLKVCFNMVEATKSKPGRDLRQSTGAAQKLSLLNCSHLFRLFRGPEVWTEHLLHRYCGSNEANAPRFLQPN